MVERPKGKMTNKPIEIGAARYDGATIVFHWLVAILIIALWTAGQLIDSLPKGLFRENLWATHVVTGFVLALLVLGRVGWRWTFGRRLPEIGPRPARKLAKLVQFGLYVVLTVAIALGIANAFNRGYAIYGILRLPQLGNPELKHVITNWHGLAANILIALAVFHAGAALVHHYLWQDDVLLRMIPKRPRPR